MAQPAKQTSDETILKAFLRLALQKVIGSPRKSATYSPTANLPGVPRAGELSNNAKYAQPMAVQPTNMRVMPGQRGRAIGAGAPAVPVQSPR